MLLRKCVFSRCGMNCIACIMFRCLTCWWCAADLKVTTSYKILLRPKLSSVLLCFSDHRSLSFLRHFCCKLSKSNLPFLNALEQRPRFEKSQHIRLTGSFSKQGGISDCLITQDVRQRWIAWSIWFVSACFSCLFLLVLFSIFALDHWSEGLRCFIAHCQDCRKTNAVQMKPCRPSWGAQTQKNCNVLIWRWWKERTSAVGAGVGVV